MICRITSKKICDFLMTAVILLLSTTFSTGAVPVEEWNRTFGVHISTKLIMFRRFQMGGILYWAGRIYGAPVNMV